jgi:hypothetical protein
MRHPFVDGKALDGFLVTITPVESRFPKLDFVVERENIIVNVMIDERFQFAAM